MLKTQTHLKQSSVSNNSVSENRFASASKRQGFLPKLIPTAMLKKFILNLPFNQIEKGSLNINVFEQTYRFEGASSGHHAELTIVNPARAYWLLKFQGELGFAQAYYEGAIVTNSLYALLHLGHDNRQAFSEFLGNKKFNFLQLLQHRKRHNSLSNSKRNISYHYDLGNHFYSLWLDKTMSYSSALYTDAEQSMEQAQVQKYQNIIDNLSVKAGDDVLEIGCGWGGFMELALQKGANVKGLTLSVEQKSFAMERLKAVSAHKSTDAQFKIDLQDYRLEQGVYDHVVSIEMFEAVGKEYWNQYFEVLKRSLKPEGKAGLQIITIADEHAEDYQNSVDFIQAYIFPGGLLPSVAQVQALADKHGFEVMLNHDFGKDYAKTCQYWKKQFNLNSKELVKNGYDLDFQRLWNYYLDYCTVGFETGHISVNQFVLKKRV